LWQGKKGELVIGLEIKPWTICLVELRHTEKGCDLTNLDIWRIPFSGDRGSGWNEAQRAKVAWELESILESYPITSQRIATSISSRDAWIRILPIQAEDTDRILSKKAEEAAAHLPFFAGNYFLDYERREEPSDEGCDMLVVAVRRECVDRIRALLDRLKSRLSVVDVDCFALEHTYRWNYDPDEWTWIAQIGARMAELVLLRKGVFQTFAILDIPVPNDRPESSSETEELKARGEDFLYILSKGLLNKAQATIKAEATEEPAEPPTLMLSGPGSQIPYLVECLQLAHPGPVILLDPFRRVRINPSVPYREEGERHSVQE